MPLDIQIDLFQKLVIPVLLYGCELYGYENIEIIERLQLKYLKYIFGLKPSTPNVMVKGETGCYPLIIHVKCRILLYLRNSKIKLTSPSLKYVKNTLDNCGLTNVWLSKSLPSCKQLTLKLRQVLETNTAKSGNQIFKTHLNVYCINVLSQI